MRRSMLLAAGTVTLLAIACGDDEKPAAEPKDDCVATDGGADGCAAIPDAGSDAPSITVIPGGPRFLGRVDTTDPAAPRFAWSGSGLVAVVSGAKISVALKSEYSELVFQPVVDGTPGARFSVGAGEPVTTVLGSELSPGDHVVELYRESEAQFGDATFGGFADGTVRGAPASSERLIEIVGDSVSAGAGNLGEETRTPSSTVTCAFSLDTQSAYETYGLELGRLLDAEVSVIAQSGWGMYRGTNGGTTLTVPSLYANTLGAKTEPLWPFTRQADAVVVNLGTNDAAQGDPGDAFETAYLSFLETVRGRYPSAWIFVALGPITNEPLLTPMRQHLANVVTASGDPKVMKIDLSAQDTSHTGCDRHPNVAEHQRMATTLAPLMKETLGW